MLAVGSWAVLLIATPYAITHHPVSKVQGAVVAVVYVGGSFVCHQAPERSFHFWGGQTPVCARCAALYWSAPFGLVAALQFARRRRSTASTLTSSMSHVTLRRTLFQSAIPTLVTAGIEVFGMAQPSTSNTARAVSAIPLGLSVAWVVGMFLAGAIRSSAGPLPVLSER